MRFVTVVLLLAVLLLSACTTSFGQQGTVLQDYYVGTKGVELGFLRGAPPSNLNELQDFDVQLLIHNQGAYDITGDQAITVNWVYDSAFLNAYDVTRNTDYLNSRSIQLHGKSYSYQNGEQDFYSIARFQAATVRSSFEKAYPEVYATICYPYKTSFAEEVCIDTDITESDVRNQVCQLTPSHRYSSGQGAPIAVTALETTFEASGPYARPVFTFTVENKDDGIFYYSTAPQCEPPTIDTMYVVGFSAQLGNESLICPDKLFLENGVGEIDCFLPGNGILLTRANYVAVLTAEISYHYQTAISVGSVVERQSTYYLNTSYGNNQCAPWDSYDPATQTCVSRCEYCSIINPGDPTCVSAETYASNPSQYKKVYPGMACIYTEAECVSAGDNCISQAGAFCSPGLFCGVPQCVSNPNRNQQPRADIEPIADPAKVSWYCTDSETNSQLQNSCGCMETSSYFATKRGVACPDDLSVYKDVTGYTSQSLLKTYFTVLKQDIPADADTLCVIVSDYAGKSRKAELRFN